MISGWGRSQAVEAMKNGAGRSCRSCPTTTQLHFAECRAASHGPAERRPEPERIPGIRRHPGAEHTGPEIRTVVLIDGELAPAAGCYCRRRAARGGRPPIATKAAPRVAELATNAATAEADRCRISLLRSGKWAPTSPRGRGEEAWRRRSASLTSSTNRDLRSDEGGACRDLYYRLTQTRPLPPPLRER